MKSYWTFFLCLVSLLLASLGATQPIAWEQRADLTSNSVATSDGAGNYYWVTREGGYGGSTLTLWKVRGTGAVIFKKVIQSINGQALLKAQFVTADAGSVYVAYESSYDVYFFDPFDEGVICLNTTDGTEKWRHYLEPVNGYYIPNGLKLAGGKVVVGGYFHTNGAPNSDVPAVSFLNAADGTEANAYVFSGFPGQFRTMAVDPAGPVYLAGNTGADDVRMVTKVDASSVGWLKLFDLAAYQFEHAIKLVLSPDGAALALGGEGRSVNDGVDILLTTLNTANGNQIGAKIVGTTSSDALADIAFDGTNVVISAYLNNSGPRVTVKRYDKQLLAESWSADIAGSYSGGSLALDPMTGLVVGTSRSVPLGNNDSQFDRLNLADGSLVWHVLGDADGWDGPTDMLVDGASNIFAVGYRNGQTGEYLARFQYVAVAFPSATAYGGAPLIGSVTLASPAPAAGITFQMSTNLVGGSIAPTLFVAGGATSAPFTLTTPAVAANTLVSVTARWNGIVEAASTTLVPPLLQGLSISPSTVFGGTNSISTVTLTGKAPAGGTSVALMSNLVSAATVPASVTVPAGALSTGFTITTTPQLVTHMVGITATTGSVTKTAYITINAPSLTGIVLTPNTLKGGTSSVLIITLDAKAPAGDVINLVSGVPSLVVLPSTVTMTAGVAAKSLSVPTAAVAAPINVTVIAYQPGSVKTATLTLTP